MKGASLKVVRGFDSQHTLWVVIESDVIGDETMSGFVTEGEAKTFHYALRSHSLADAEKLRRAALVRVERGKYTTPRVFMEP
jgi:hypothetical protein